MLTVGNKFLMFWIIIIASQVIEFNRSIYQRDQRIEIFFSDKFYKAFLKPYFPMAVEFNVQMEYF